MVARVWEDGDWGVPGREASTVVSEDFDRSPFAGEDQFRKTIAVEIAPHGSSDTADFFQEMAVGCIQLQLLSIVAKEARRSGLWPATRNDTATNEEIQLPITVHVRHGQRSATGIGCGQLFCRFQFGARP